VAKGDAVKVCPKCGLPYSYVSREKRGSNYYFYAVHVSKSGNKRRVKKCYLGAESYDYVARFNPELGRLAGLIDRTKALRYLEELLEWFIYAPVDSKTVEEAVNIVRRYEVELLARREELKRREELEAEAGE